MIQNRWQKSSYSNPSGNCLEAKIEAGIILIRDTKLGELSPVLQLPLPGWQVFLAEVKGFVTFPASNSIYTSDAYDGMRLESVRSTDVLVFTVAEWDAFLAGARAGEFDPQSV